MRRVSGLIESSTVAGETAQAFVPHPLPPRDPPIAISAELEARCSSALAALGRLDVASDLVPSIDWFVYAFVRKEAVLSAQIEGTQATLLDLFALEAAPELAPSADVEEVCGSLNALRFGWEELGREDGLPLSMRLLSECHTRLLAGARGATKQPGTVRRIQNWIGGGRPSQASFVPPPPHHLPQLLSDLERFMHAESDLPPLLRIGLLHAQFETIHPFLDGNGRLGRLLITLLLKHYGLLREPVLYLSLFLKVHREEYYRRLNATRAEGDFEGWLQFFTEGVATVAEQAIAAARSLHLLMDDCKKRLRSRPDNTLLAGYLLDDLPKHPYLNSMNTMKLLRCSRPAAAKALGVLEQAEILVPIDDRKKNRTLAFSAYLEILQQDTLPLPR